MIFENKIIFGIFHIRKLCKNKFEFWKYIFELIGRPGSQSIFALIGKPVGQYMILDCSFIIEKP